MDSAQHVYLDSADYTILTRAALKSFLAATKKLISKNCLLFLNSFDDSLIIESFTRDVDVIEAHSAEIARLAYLNLGCVQVKLFCLGIKLKEYSFNYLKDYNEFQETKTDTAMPTTLDRPAQYQVESPQSNSAWISFEQLSQMMSLAPTEVEAMARTQGIPQSQNADGEWGLAPQEADNLSRVYYAMQQEKVSVQLRSLTIPEPSPEPAAQEEILSPEDFAESISSIAATNGASSNPAPTQQSKRKPRNRKPPGETTMRFPSNYKVGRGDNAKGLSKYDTSLKNALTKAGKESPVYLQRIIDGTASESFMDKLLKSFPTETNQKEEFIQAAQRKLAAMQQPQQ